MRTPAGAAAWPLSPDPLLKDALDLWSSRALAAGQQLGVFAELGRGPRTAARLAGTLGLEPDAARDLLDALLALGWLQREGDDARAVYVSTRVGAHYLDPRSPAYLGDLLLAARAPWSGPHDAWLDDALRTAGPAGAAPPAWESARVMLRQHLGALHGEALAQAGVAGTDGTVLDLHGEGARLACAWAAHARRGLGFTSLQAPAQLPAALAHVQARGLAARVRVLAAAPAAADAGDTRTTWPTHDTAVLSLLLEPGGGAARRARLAQAACALAPGGWLLVLEHLADDARRLHAPALVFGLAGRMTGQARGALTEGELRQDCRACGLRDADCLPLPGGASVLRAQRPR